LRYPLIDGHQCQVPIAGGHDASQTAANTPEPIDGYPTAIPPPDKKCRKTTRMLYKHGLMLIRVILAVNDFMFLAGFSEERINDIKH
jgi:hypothetical protein